MPWLKLSFDTDAGSAERLSDALSEAGAVSVTFEDLADQPLYELAPGETILWQHTRVIGLFAHDADMDQVLAQLQHALPGLPQPKLEHLEDQVWERAWMEHFHPISFGQRLWICPSWQAPPDPHAINIMLDPGLAFGTGSHATTALCLAWLDQHDLTQKEVIDYGCGSGILAIAAAMLGAKHVYAVDHDPQAWQATRANALANAVADKISIVAPHALPDRPVDIIIANILAQPLIELAPRLAALIKHAGAIILSGILKNQAQEVLAAYRPWFTMAAPVIRDDWVRLDGIRL